jgi:glycosyltransferase involved in cell wall biosynthesis
MVPAHDRKLTVEEFGRLGLEYPFLHISDDKLWQIYSEGYRLADVVLTQSHRSARLLREYGCQNVEVVPGGIIWPTNIKPITAEKFTVGYLGAIGPDKGLLYLIQAWGITNYPDATLVFAGSGSEMLEPFIRRNSNVGKFTLLGRIPDVSDFYNSISVYVQPSVTEGFALEIPEAMAHGRPVIAADGAGAADLIENGVNGFVVPIRNPNAIAEKIDFFKKNPSELVAMGLKAQETAKEYTWERAREKYRRIYQGLLSFHD